MRSNPTSAGRGGGGGDALTMASAYGVATRQRGHSGAGEGKRWTMHSHDELLTLHRYFVWAGQM